MATIPKIYITLTQYFMCIYWGYMCIYLQDIRFLWSMLSLGKLYTDDTNDDDNDNDDNNDNNDANDKRRTNNDCIGSLACMQNEPKTENSSWNCFVIRAHWEDVDSIQSQTRFPHKYQCWAWNQQDTELHNPRGSNNNILVTKYLPNWCNTANLGWSLGDIWVT